MLLLTQHTTCLCTATDAKVEDKEREGWLSFRSMVYSGLIQSRVTAVCHIVFFDTSHSRYKWQVDCFSNSGAYSTHNATKPLSDITGGFFFRLHAASNGAIRLYAVFDYYFCSSTSTRPVNTPSCVKDSLPLKGILCEFWKIKHTFIQLWYIYTC